MNMTTRPTSHLIHSGFLDILSLIPPSTQPVSHPQQEGRKPEDDLRKILSDHTTASPRPKPKKEREKEGRKSIEQGLKKRKIDKAIIGPPMDFRYVPHHLHRHYPTPPKYPLSILLIQLHLPLRPI
jgi:hypothetical protein